MAQTRKVVVVGGVRIPFARSGTQYSPYSNQDLMTGSLKALVNQYNLKDVELGDVCLGSVMKHSRDFNLARESTLGSGLKATTPGVDVQRACGTSLEAAISIANRIALGQIEVGIAGGVDNNNDVPMQWNAKFARRLVGMSRAKTLGDRLKLWKGFSPKELKPVVPQVSEPRTGLSMGQHCELMAQEWEISREEQDKLALESHQRACTAYDKGFYSDLVSSFGSLDRDNNLRANTSLEKLAKLKPAFERSSKGTLTAGNSTPLTDGSAAVLLCSEAWAKKHNLEPLAYFGFSQVAAVDFVAGEGLLMAPTIAVDRLLKHEKLKLQDFDLYELHEAFAAQVLCTLKAWESEKYCKERLDREQPLGSIDRAKLNVVGGSVGVGHPFAATGARIVATGAKLLKEHDKKRLLISVCAAGGMGVAAVLER